jgi:alpha-tubulin suppressor-like RCC1 family protein
MGMICGFVPRVFSYNVAIWPGDDISAYASPASLTNIVSISGGENHAIALRADGTVVFLSGGYFPPLDVTNGVQIASGWCQDLVVKADGTVVESYCRGGMPAGITNAVAAAGGYEHDLVLLADGTCVSWGWMTVGSAYVPTGLSNVVAVAAGFDVSAALTADGTVANWGYTGYGGTGGNGLTGISAIALGHSHGLALRTNGTVVVWGSTAGQPPVTLTNVLKIGAKQQWACALQSNGALIGWGAGAQTACPDQPLTNVIQLAPMNWAGMLLVGDGPPQPLWKLTNVTALAYDTVKFKGEAVGTEPLTYQWFFNGTNLPGAISPTLSLTNLQPEQAGDYYVVASNAFGVKTNSGAQVQFLPFTVTAQPTNQTVFGGDSATLVVVAQGSANYQWRFSGTNLDGATNSQITLANLTTNQAGAYSVAVSNAYGYFESTNATLTVVPVSITTPPTSQSKYIGDSVSFSVAAAKNGPFTYQWQHSATNLPSQTNATLTLVNLASSDAGGYSAVVSNPYGSATSPSANLNVFNSVPLINTQPITRGAYLNGSASFQVTADGTKPFTYQWLFNGTNLANATGATLTLTNLASANGGNYSVLVGNAAGSTLSSNAALVFLNVLTWGQTNNYGLNVIPLELTNAIAVAVGNSHSVALKSTGRVVVWGYNGSGQTNVPTSATNIIAIAAAQDHTLALRSNGTVVAWGIGGTNVPAGLTNVIAVAAGDYHSMALRADGTVVAWGDGGFVNSASTNVPANATNIVAIAAGGSFCVALKQNGTVMDWGTSYSFLGITNAVAIAANEFPITILKADGRVHATNVLSAPTSLSNAVGVVAQRYTASALRADGTITNWGSGGPVTPIGLTNVAVLASGQYVCLAILGNGLQPGPIPSTNLKRISNAFSLTTPAQSGHLYWLEYKTSLSDTNWKTLPLNLGISNSVNLTDTAATNSARFYRIRKW